MTPDDYKEMLAAFAASQTKPTSGPLPRRARIYLVDDRPEINGRPMDVNRTDAREWIRAGLAKAEPFSQAGAGEPVMPSEYRAPEDPRMVPLAFNPNSGRYEPVPAASLLASAAAPSSPDLEKLIAAEVERRLAAHLAPAAPAPATATAADDAEAELEALRAAWSEANPGEKYPPAAKAAWFRKRLES